MDKSDYNNHGIDDDKELIYNENLGFQHGDKLFDDNADQPILYEVELKITDKVTKMPRYIKVDLEKISYQKPMLGGLVNKTTGVYYFNSYAQTDQY